jgi:nitrate/nitrite-specific signal transduction histidine kinase
MMNFCLRRSEPRYRAEQENSHAIFQEKYGDEFKRPGFLRADGHWGLKGMRERAERIGARLRLSSQVALGTEVELRVPGSIAFQQATVAVAY